MRLFCPNCQCQLEKGEWGYICSHCSFFLPYIHRHYRLPFKEVQKLLTEGKTSLISEWQKKDGSGTFNGYLSIEKGRVVFHADFIAWGKCPLCGSRLYTFSKGISCEECDFMVWQTVAGKRLSQNELMTLIIYRRTEKLSHFISKESGKYFDAALVINDEGEVIFEF